MAILVAQDAHASGSLWQTLAWFLFSTIFGWWVLFIGAFIVSLPFIRAYRAWAATRRFIRAQGLKFVNPQNADARYQLAELHRAAGRWRPAAVFAEQAVGIASSNPLFEGVPYAYLLCLGQSFYGLRRFNESSAAFERALKSTSELGYADALLGLAKAKHRLGDHGKALEFAKHALDEQQSQLEAYFRWAQAAAKLGKFDEVSAATERFHTVAASLPRFAGRQRTRWRLAFLIFPISRRIA